ncbi:hypothetical protein Stsp01_41150 [Streptomyces sp. NBRC 13847]|nr:hypothetical protein Stsp01_41150 [Streptomyces sp. NBRC 13847]
MAEPAGPAPTTITSALCSERAWVTESVTDADSVTVLSPGSRYLDFWVPPGTGRCSLWGHR